MWWSDRRTLLAALGAVVASGALAGCGFRPAYAPGGTGQAVQGRIRAADPVTRADFQFVAALEDRLGRPTAPRFDLGYSLTVTRLEGTTRTVLTGSADYDLTEGDRPRARGRVTAETAFSTTATQLAAQTAEEDAELRLMRMLAEAVVLRLLADPQLAA